MKINDYISLILKASNISIWNLNIESGAIKKLFGNSIDITSDNIDDFCSNYLNDKNSIHL